MRHPHILQEFNRSGIAIIFDNLVLRLDQDINAQWPYDGDLLGEWFNLTFLWESYVFLAAICLLLAVRYGTTLGESI